MNFGNLLQQAQQMQRKVNKATFFNARRSGQYGSFINGNY